MGEINDPQTLLIVFDNFLGKIFQNKWHIGSKCDQKL